MKLCLIFILLSFTTSAQKANPFSIELRPRVIDNAKVIEGSLWSDELRVAGRTDLIADFEGKLAVIDYKTSRSKKDWEMCHKYFMQGAFYAHAFQERTGIPINNIVIIMAVEQNDPIIFRETKDRWIEPLKQVITKYS